MAYNMKEIIITVSVLIICIMLVRRICRGKIAGRFQYALWFLVVLRLMIPVSIPVSLPTAGFMDKYHLIELKTDDVVEQLEKPIQVTIDSQSGIYHLLVDEDSQTKDADSMKSDGSSVVFMVGHLRYSWLDILGTIWTGGMIVAAAWILATNWIFSRRLKKSRRVMELSEQEMCALQEKLPQKIAKMYGSVTVYIAEGLVSPCLYGLPGREAVYLPLEIAKDTDQLCHVLTHELCHKKHKDSFWGILRELLVTVYWFHPLVWAAAILSKQDCELACDETALLLLGEEERISYGETLLSIITRKSRVFDLLCNATTMTGSAKSVKERIGVIAKKPTILRGAVALTVVIIGVAFAFAFTKRHENIEIRVFGQDIDTVTGADMQIPLPESIRGICGQVTEKENEDVIIYHVESRQEVGRFSRKSLKDTLQLVDEGRRVVPIGDYGDNYLLKAYMGIDGGAVGVTQHIYTPGQDVGVLQYEDIIIPENSNEANTVPGTDSNMQSRHVYEPGMDENTQTEHVYEPGTDENTQSRHVYEPGTDENTQSRHVYEPGTDENTQSRHVYEPGTDTNSQTEYLISEENDGTQIPAPEETENYTIFLPYEEGQSLEAAELVRENVLDDTVDYLPNEEIITSVIYPSKEINIDELPHRGCYVYIKADYGKVEDKYFQDMERINEELEKAAADVVVLSLNGKIREELLNDLTKNRTLYVGDNVKVSALVNALPVPSTLNLKGDLSLQTVEEPYSLRFSYEMTTTSILQEDLDMIYFNAAMLFYAIGNVEEIAVDVRQPSGSDMEDLFYIYNRADMEENFAELSKADYENEEAFRQGLSQLHAAVAGYLHSQK